MLWSRKSPAPSLLRSLSETAFRRLVRSSTGDGPRHQWCEHELHCPPVSDAAMPGPSHLGGHIPASLLLPTALSLSLTRGITDFGLSRERLMQLAPCRRCRTPTKCRGRAAGDERPWGTWAARRHGSTQSLAADSEAHAGPRPGCR